MRIAITGATGLLGRNLLFEIIKQNLQNLKELEIIIFGRGKDLSTLQERINKLLLDDGCSYIGIRDDNKTEFLTSIKGVITPILFDLLSDNLSVSVDDFNVLTNKPIDIFFHLAALSDFRLEAAIKEKLLNTNVGGTTRVLKLIDSLQVGQIIYTGSAYSCGAKDGEVFPDYSNPNEQFRNYYEETKLLGEIEFVSFAKSRGLRYKIFRPVGICGRTIEAPIGKTNKYDLFYGWAAFFLRQKLKAVDSLENVYKTTVSLPIRIEINLEGSANFIPSDHCAKILYNVCIHYSGNGAFHLASKNNIKHQAYLKAILDRIRIDGYQWSNDRPDNKSALETLYYKSVGRIFTPYLIGKEINFNQDNLLPILKKHNIALPEITDGGLKQLINFAANDYFGIERKD